MTGRARGDRARLELERARAAAGRSRPAGRGGASRRARGPARRPTTWPGGRPGRGSSRASSSATSGRRASSWKRKATVEVVVSWPANSSVITSSRTWRSDRPLPSSSSASSSSESRSSPRSPVARRRPISPSTSVSSLRARALQRRPGRARAAQDLEPVVAAVVGERALELARRDRARLRAPVGVEAEQRSHRHAQREVARPAVEVDRVARSPGRDPARRSPRASCERGGDPLAVEGGQA